MEGFYEELIRSVCTDLRTLGDRGSTWTTEINSSPVPTLAHEDRTQEFTSDMSTISPNQIEQVFVYPKEF